jgi:hypothetical protein
MGRSVFDGYLTDACAECDAWSDGKNGAPLGCCYCGPIMNCEAFRKTYEEDQKNEE